MADKAINELTLAAQINDNDLFVLEQGNTAKKLQGSTLRAYATSAGADAGRDAAGELQRGYQGYSVTSVTKTSTSGLVDTYQVRSDNPNQAVLGTFQVTNGRDGTGDVRSVNGLTGAVSTRLIFTNKAVWNRVNSGAYEDYPYEYKFNCANVTTNMIPEVILSLNDATSGNFAPIASIVSDGIVVVYAKEDIGSITAPTIICWR